jgi:hypothetical protein
MQHVELGVSLATACKHQCTMQPGQLGIHRGIVSATYKCFLLRRSHVQRARPASHHCPGNLPLSLECPSRINPDTMAQTMIMSGALTCKPFLATPAARPTRSGKSLTTASTELERYYSRDRR